MTPQLDPLPEDLEESVHGEGVPVAEELLLRRLTLLLADDPKLVGRDKDMFVVGDDEIRGSWTDHRTKLLCRHVLIQ